MSIRIVKKDGRTEDWNFQKVLAAIRKSGDRVNSQIAPEQHDEFEQSLLSKLSSEDVSIPDMHKAVEMTLSEFAPDIAKSYRDFRNYKEEFVGSWDHVYKCAENVLHLGDKENANFDSTLISTKGALIRGDLTKELFKKFHLTKVEKDTIEDGFIYIHDLRDLIFNAFNCCLFDMGNVLRGGFEMSNLQYAEPSRVESALQVIGDIMLNATAQQFGGFTVPDIDKILIPYVKKSYANHLSEAKEWGMGDKAGSWADAKVRDELRQGFQAIEMRLNSVPSSRGDFAFTTFSFGNVDAIKQEDRDLQTKICEAILYVRMKGHGKNQPVTFPKLVYLFNQEEYDRDEQYRKLFDLSVECSSKAMYPDYLAVNSEGYVSEMYQKHKKVVSPMGCRAYLSEYIHNDGEAYFTGRANIGACSLNLPMIWKKSEGENFYEDLDTYMGMIRKFLKKRYAKVAQNPASTNPLCFTQGGLLGGNKHPNEPIGHDIAKSFTASFGITALNELNILMEGKPLHESDQKLVNEVVDHILAKIDEFKKEDGYLYALYGTPAESLCGTQLKQFRKMYGVIEGVSDKDYFSNSFHCHVTADITPFEKQDKEYTLFHKVNGGHIQYTRFTNHNNIDAIKTTILRGMSMGFYSGVNFDLVICEKCGHRPDGDVEHCPCCGSDKIMMLNRLCGYIGYGKAGGDTRFNASKLAEVKDRVSM